MFFDLAGATAKSKTFTTSWEQPVNAKWLSYRTIGNVIQGFSLGPDFPAQ
jgi:hypothetical protein